MNLAGWKTYRTHELGEIQAGRQRSPHHVAGRSRPYLRVANVFDGYIDDSDVYQMQFTDSEYERYKLSPGDILLNEGQSLELVGRCAMYEGHPEACCFQNTLVRFRCNGKSQPDFMLVLFQYLQMNGQFSRIASQTTSVAHLGVSRFSRLKVSIPPKPVQHRIVQVVSSFTRAIDQAERLLALKERRKRALMQQLLTGQRRICGNPITPVGKSGISSSWEFPRARELFRSISIKNRAEEAVLSVTQDQGVVRRDSLDRKIEADAKNHSSYKLVEPGDFVISLRSFQGGLEYCNLRGVVSPAYHVIRATRKIDHDYFRYLFKSYWFIGHLATAVIGIRDGKQISFDDFGFMRLPYPPLEEQRCIASVLKTCDEEIGLLRELVEALKQQKKGLMQQLLTGQVRVPLVTKDGTHDS